MDKQAVWLEFQKIFRNKYQVTYPLCPAQLERQTTILNALHYWKVGKAISNWRKTEDNSLSETVADRPRKKKGFLDMSGIKASAGINPERENLNWLRSMPALGPGIEASLAWWPHHHKEAHAY